MKTSFKLRNQSTDRRENHFLMKPIYPGTSYIVEVQHHQECFYTKSDVFIFKDLPFNPLANHGNKIQNRISDPLVFDSRKAEPPSPIHINHQTKEKVVPQKIYQIWQNPLKWEGGNQLSKG